MNEAKERLFTETVREKRGMLLRLALSLLCSEADAEDAVSCGVESTWRRLYRIRDDKALLSCLTRSVIGAARYELGRRRRLMPPEPTEDTLEAPPEDRGIADRAAGLDEKYRLPILLRYGEDLGENEIAAILRVPRGTVSSRISRGLGMLGKETDREGVEDELREALRSGRPDPPGSYDTRIDLEVARLKLEEGITMKRSTRMLITAAVFLALAMAAAAAAGIITRRRGPEEKPKPAGEVMESGTINEAGIK